MTDLVIVGAGGLGREVLAWARQATVPFRVKGFLDDNPTALARFRKDVPLLASVQDYQPEPADHFICAIGTIAFKRRCVEWIRRRGGNFTTLIHRSAVVGDHVTLGDGVLLCPHVVVTSDVRLGDFVTVNLHSSIAHDAQVGAWSQVHCHVDLTGGVCLGEGVLVGSHASVLPGVRVGDGAVIGAGSVVTRDVPAGTTVFGVPARPYAQRNPEASVA